jgi:hypothetical protein
VAAYLFQSCQSRGNFLSIPALTWNWPLFYSHPDTYAVQFVDSPTCNFIDRTLTPTPDYVHVKFTDSFTDIARESFQGLFLLGLTMFL